MSSNEKISNIKLIAESKNGLCLSDSYVNNRSKLKFKCEFGHIWETTSYVIESGSWCKKCSMKKIIDNQRDDIKVFKKIAELKGGKCISETYINQHSKLLFECKKGHQWFGRPQGIKRGTWCGKCYGTAKSDIKEMQDLANQRGGVCISLDYKNDATKLKWKCSENHIWEATPNNIKHGKWCPTCSEGLGERVCRLYFQKIFQKPFIKVRPEWLRNKTGFPLELDGYCEELKIAFEHQGRQHYKKTSLFQSNFARDEYKRTLCKKNGVKLIEIPEVLTDTKIEDLKEFIRKQCELQKIKLPKDFKAVQVSYLEIFTYTKNQEKQLLINNSLAIINSKNGRHLETTINDKGILTFKTICENQHQWTLNYYNLANGKWCPYCYRKSLSQKMRIPLTELKRIAKIKGGICLTKSLLENPKQILWQCAEGHQWLASATRVKSGNWCPKCAGNSKGELSEVLKIIQEKKGVCNDKGYDNNYSVFNIFCDQGHNFTTIAKRLKKGNWCPKCAIENRAAKKRLTIYDMQTLAKRKNGKCVSTVYKNDITKLLWECVHGHQWLARPSNIRTGHWCPLCAGKSKYDK